MGNITNMASQKLIHAFKNVNSGQDIYDALIEIPTMNLLDMNEMIANILTARFRADHAECEHTK